MKYVLLGTLSQQWAGRQSERTEAAKAKLDKLGVKLLSVNYTQGEYDFVDVVEASDAEGVLAFSIWYAREGYGRICSMPAFDEAAMTKAAKKA